MADVASWHPGMRLYRWRKARRLSQAVLADNLGTTQQTLSRWERGVLVPSPRRMREIHLLTGGWVRPDHFIIPPVRVAA